MMPQSDALVEGLYNLVNRQGSERARADVARAALLAAQFRAEQLSRAAKAARLTSSAGDDPLGRRRAH